MSNTHHKSLIFTPPQQPVPNSDSHSDLANKRRSPRLTLNTRDELLVIDTSLISYLQADGNYTHIHYITGQRLTVSLGLTKMEALLSGVFVAGARSPFYRLGRSLIINQHYLQNISLPRQKLVLSDGRGACQELTVHKTVLSQFKALLVAQIEHQSLHK